METGAIQSLATAGARRLEEPQEGPESSGFVDTLREVVSKANE
jgi:hypothetical protein